MGDDTGWVIDGEELRRWEEEGERLEQEADELVAEWREHFGWVTDFHKRRAPSTPAGQMPALHLTAEEWDELEQHAAEMERLVTLMVQRTVEAAVHAARFPRPKPRPTQQSRQL